MKTVRVRVSLLLCMLTAAAVVLCLRSAKDKQPNPSAVAKTEPAQAQIPAHTNRPAMPPSFTTRASDMTDDEKARLAKDFEERYKPTVEKWFKAYEGRIPFRLEDFTLEKFHYRFGDYMYTFMIDRDTTFTIQDAKGKAKVVYLMSRKAAIAMNSLPKPGFVPDFTVPVKREDAIRMIEADSAIRVKPNEIIIKPTAMSSALNGGAFVDLLPTGLDPNNGLSYKISLVFGSDGNLVNYERDTVF